MRLLLLSVLAGLMTACETGPPPIEYDFATFEALNAEVIKPSELPDISPLKCYPSEADCRIAGWTAVEDIDRFEKFKILAEGNTEIADNNADALSIMLEREEAILAAAKAQEQMTGLYVDLLDYERKERWREKWYYRVLLVLTAGAGVYAAGK